MPGMTWELAAAGEDVVNTVWVDVLARHDDLVFDQSFDMLRVVAEFT